MAEELEKCDINNAQFLENSSSIKRESDQDYLDDKVFVCNTIINISGIGLKDHANSNKFEQFEISVMSNMKNEIHNNINNVKGENDINAIYIKTEFSNKELFCDNCQENYEDYCTKCGMLVHILNGNYLGNTYYNAIEGIPKNNVEIRELFGRLGIFSLKTIPEGVKFGPFTGLSGSGQSWRVKEGKFVVNDDKLKCLNWMCHINFAKNITEQNLLILQYENRLYYESNREIQKDEELLVYFGEVCLDNLNKNVELDFIPITDQNVKNVFACTFCCLGFSSEEYLAKHKIICCSETSQKFSLEELTQCLFCDIFLGKNEYLEYHMNYCSKQNVRRYTLPAPDDQTIQVSSLNKPKRQRREVYKCGKCKYESIYKSDLKNHTNKHYEVKKYRCRICHRKFKTKESLKMHVENTHIECDNTKVHIKVKRLNLFYSVLEKQFKCSLCEFQTKSKQYLRKHMNVKHFNGANFKCVKCEYETNWKPYLNKHVRTKHLREITYKCVQCEFETYYQSSLRSHIKTKHIGETTYNCIVCEYKTRYKVNLRAHMKRKHLRQNDFRCIECEYRTHYIPNLKAHIKRRHPRGAIYKCSECVYETSYKPYLKKHVKANHSNLMEADYKCTECEYKTNSKSHFERHINAKHLKENNYKCMECEFETLYKPSVERHMKIRHSKEANYQCKECEYQTNYKPNLGRHMKIKHLQEINYQCTECEYKTSYKPYLESHVKGHFKETNYNCTECEYKAKYTSRLRAHINKKHLRKIDYKCTECQYHTYYKSNLKRHAEKHLKPRINN